MRKMMEQVFDGKGSIRLFLLEFVVLAIFMLSIVAFFSLLSVIIVPDQPQQNGEYYER